VWSGYPSHCSRLHLIQPGLFSSQRTRLATHVRHPLLRLALSHMVSSAGPNDCWSHNLIGTSFQSCSKRTCSLFMPALCPPRRPPTFGSFCEASSRSLQSGTFLLVMERMIGCLSSAALFLTHNMGSALSADALHPTHLLPEFADGCRAEVILWRCLRLQLKNHDVGGCTEIHPYLCNDRSCLPKEEDVAICQR